MRKPETDEHRRMRVAEDECARLRDGLARAIEDACNVRGRLDESKAHIANLERSIGGLVVDGYDKDGPYTKDCVACLACNTPYDFRHCEGCVAKPALDLVFGPNDADHCRYRSDEEDET